MPFCITLLSYNVPWIHEVTLGIAYAILCATTILSNCILMFTLYKTKQLKTISNKFVFAMSISDLLLGLTILPVLTINSIKKNIFKNCLQEHAVSYALLLLSYFTVSISFCIAIDRYIRVMKGNRYNLYMNSVRMQIMIIASIVAANINAVLSTVHPSFAQQLISVSFGLLLICFGSFIYTILLRKLRNHSRQLVTSNFNQHRSLPVASLDNRGRTADVSSTNQALPYRVHVDKNIQQLSAVKTIQCLLVSVAIFCSPYHIMSCWWTYHRYQLKTDPGVYVNISFAWSAFLALLFPSWNSWILICGNRQSRRFVFSLFRRNRIESSNGT